MGKASAAIAVIATALLVTSAGSAATRGGGSSAVLYTVAFNTSSLPANVDQLVADAGGTIVVRVPEIGGIGVLSSNSSFASQMDVLASVAASQPSSKSSVGPVPAAARVAGVGATPQAEPDALGSQQWDKMRMNVSLSGSYALNRGRPDVRVALTDTGVDVNHPDISPNLDVADSRSFVASEPTIQDYNGHGTWTASAVAAPINRVGISGVAPNVSIVELKTNDASGNGDLLSIDQALVYAAHMHFDVVSSSIVSYVPVCVGGRGRKKGCDDADYILAQRAADLARQAGVLVVAALGNDDLDLSDPEAVGKVFHVTSGVAEVPGGLAGVVGVSSTGYFDGKAFYSNYGAGVVDVAAPGGDSVFQPAPSSYIGGGLLAGAVSSTARTLPSVTQQSCVRGICGLYGWEQGTSMATPNAAGVAALIVSRYGSPHLSPDAVESKLEGTAATQPCPQPATVYYNVSKAYASATCVGDRTNNGFFGHGIVDAVAALTSG